MAGFIGPVLPPTISIEDQEQAKQNESTNNANEALPSVEGCQPCSSTCPEESPPAVNRQKETFGPALPVAVYGPALPLHITQSSTPDAQGSSPEPDSEADEEVVGPMPAGEEEREQAERRRKKLEIEKHSQTMKQKLSGKDKGESKLERESWMIELPANKKTFGLGPRKFREAAFEPGDQSVWTDTPADRERKSEQPQKVKKKTEVEIDALEAARNKEMRRRIEEYNKEHRSESLVEIHKKKRAAEVVGKEERKPFNRDTDLEIARTVAPAKKQALLKDSGSLLASKFTPSKQSFL